MQAVAGAPGSPSGTAAVVVGRQPIVDRDGAVVAFELLYRSGRTDDDGVSGEQMTVDVLMGALSIGVDQLVGDRTVFCNAERSVITGETPVTLPPHRTVIEVLESVVIDDEIVEGCRRLSEAGYRIALDDFVWIEGAERLLELASVVKLDVLALTRTQVLELVERCRPYGVVLLAEKVETAEDVAWAREAGFDLFQGYAIERPAVVHGRTVGASAVAQVQLALTVLEDDLDLRQLETTLRREPGLVVQLLQLASAGSHLGMRRQVHTVREALVLLGTTRVRQWVVLTVLGGQTGGSPDGLATALTRARMVELLAPSREAGSAEFAFTAGLLSTLDLLLGLPLADLVGVLDLDPLLADAALRRQGPVGRLVEEVAAYQESLHGAGPGLRGGATSELDATAAAAFAWAMPHLVGPGA